MIQSGGIQAWHACAAIPSDIEGHRHAWRLAARDRRAVIERFRDQCLSERVNNPRWHDRCVPPIPSGETTRGCPDSATLVAGITGPGATGNLCDPDPPDPVVRRTGITVIDAKIKSLGSSQRFC